MRRPARHSRADLPPDSPELAGEGTPGHRDARDRFQNLDPYRVEREWRRYEGTAQRDLFRDLRVRFLRRHPTAGRWVVDVGSGPGRFLPYLGSPDAQRIALDLSVEMLRRTDFQGGISAHLVRGDGISPPLARSAFAAVAVIGNALGFAGPDAERFLESAESLVRPGGLLLLEVVAGAGERSRYLSRLAPRTLARLLRSPIRAVQLRADREGFLPEPARRPESGEFRRFDPAGLAAQFRLRGWQVREVVAVAPALGASPAAIEEARTDPKAWTHLLELEELIGHSPERWRSAAAVLLAFSAPSPPKTHD
ncbi:MAG: class I SAM-dependent methyltransferase [Thermoplasmata archaeon]|nr:class I SAM-dependent methyltransferase [Thermoplasmata archaeon]